MSHLSLIQINLCGNTHSDFQSSQSHQTYTLFHCIFPNVYGCSQIEKTSSFWILLLYRNHWLKVLSIIMKTCLEHIIVLNLKCNLSQLFHVCCWKTVEDADLMLEKICVAAPHKLICARKICFFVCSLSFFCFFHFCFLAYWDYCDYRKFAEFD